MLLDNWEQKLETIALPRQDGDDPSLYRFRVSGSNWTANSTVPLYVVRASMNPGDRVSDFKDRKVIDLVPDADGVIQPIEVSYLEPNPPPEAWLFLAEYHNGNDIYEPRLDARSTSTVVAPGPLRPRPEAFVTLVPDWEDKSPAPASGDALPASDRQSAVKLTAPSVAAAQLPDGGAAPDTRPRTTAPTGVDARGWDDPLLLSGVPL